MQREVSTRFHLHMASGVFTEGSQAQTPHPNTLCLTPNMPARDSVSRVGRQEQNWLGPESTSRRRSEVSRCASGLKVLVVLLFACTYFKLM